MDGQFEDMARMTESGDVPEAFQGSVGDLDGAVRRYQREREKDYRLALAHHLPVAGRAPCPAPVKYGSDRASATVPGMAVLHRPLSQPCLPRVQPPCRAAATVLGIPCQRPPAAQLATLTAAQTGNPQGKFAAMPPTVHLAPRPPPQQATGTAPHAQNQFAPPPTLRAMPEQRQPPDGQIQESPSRRLLKAASWAGEKDKSYLDVPLGIATPQYPSRLQTSPERRSPHSPISKITGAVQSQTEFVTLPMVMFDG